MDSSRLVRLAAAGGLAGLAIFFIVNPSVTREEEAARGVPSLDPGRVGGTLANVFLEALVLGAIIAVVIGALVLITEEFGSPPRRAVTKTMRAVVVGAVVGAGAGLVAQAIFSVAGLAMLGGPIGWPILAAGRGIAWGVLGAGAGASIGYALGSWSRARISILGGLAGGFAGGILFDIIAAVTQGGTASRLIGFTIMGTAIGAAVALVEESVKQHWVTVLSGPKEGKTYILTKPVTTIGRDELADIPLFGDSSIAKQHAELRIAGQSVTLAAVGQGAVTVNGAPVSSAVLNDSDTIGVGRYFLRLYQKASGQARSQQRWSSQTVPEPTAVSAASHGAAGRLVLTVVSGPHAGARFEFGPGTVRIGREPGCEVPLAHDTMVSRNHAEIAWDGARWVARDLGSTNGLWVNGARVTEHVLTVGDQIGAGQTWLSVEGV